MAPARVPTVTEEPAGLLYMCDFVSRDEEAELVACFEEAAFSEVRMRGQAAFRTVLHYGYRYDYEAWTLTPAEPWPGQLDWLRDRAAALMEVAADDIAEVLVTRYPPGSGIGWHRDAPMFGPRVAGVSLLSSCSLRFQRRTPGVRLAYRLELAPRSVYVLAGAARTSWQHSIPATKGLRYSVTFRTLAHPGSASARGARSDGGDLTP